MIYGIMTFRSATTTCVLLIHVSVVMISLASVKAANLIFECEKPYKTMECLYEEGDTLRINCSLPESFNLSSANQAVASMNFMHDKKPFNRSFVHQLTDRTVLLEIPNVPVKDGHFKCALQELIGNGNVCIAKRPTVPIKYACARNSTADVVTCSWTPTAEEGKPNCGVKTKQEFFWRNKNTKKSSDSEWRSCPKQGDGNCTWNASQVSELEETICVKVKAVNIVSKSTEMKSHFSEDECFDLTTSIPPFRLPDGAIAGIVIGSIIVVGLVLFCGVVIISYCKKFWRKYVHGLDIEVPNSAGPNKLGRSCSEQVGYSTTNGNDPYFCAVQPMSPLLLNSDVSTTSSLVPLLAKSRNESDAGCVPQNGVNYPKYSFESTIDEVEDDDNDGECKPIYVCSYTVPGITPETVNQLEPVQPEVSIGEADNRTRNDYAPITSYKAETDKHQNNTKPSYYNVGPDVVRTPDADSSTGSPPICKYVALGMVSPSVSPTTTIDNFL